MGAVGLIAAIWHFLGLVARCDITCCFAIDDVGYITSRLDNERRIAAKIHGVVTLQICLQECNLLDAVINWLDIWDSMLVNTTRR